MNQLIPTQQNDSGEILVTGRDLYEFLNLKTPYTRWFKRMCEYGFAENVDFIVTDIFVKDDTAFGGKRKIIDHHIKLDMAKEISMLQRNERGKQARQYFIDIERKWNSPEMIIQRAMQIQQKKIEQLEAEKKELLPKATYHDLVLQSDTLLTVTQIAKDFGMGAPTLNKILHELGVQYKKGHRWYLYHQYQDKGYTQSKTYEIGRASCRERVQEY